MAVKKSFQVFSDLLVFNSIEPTIETIPTDGYDGAHRYRVRLCNGFNKKTQTADYVDKTTTLQFIQKNEDGTVIPGLQSEQLALILLDRVKKLNAKFTHLTNEKQIAGLEMYLDARKERVQERIDRGGYG